MSRQGQVYFADRLSSPINPVLSTDIIKKSQKKIIYLFEFTREDSKSMLPVYDFGNIKMEVLLDYICGKTATAVYSSLMR